VTTFISITYRESRLSRRDVAAVFFSVAGATTNSEELKTHRPGAAFFRIYGFYNRVIETTLANRLTAIDPLAEVRINGQAYASRGIL
jgi:hypothetical protein